MTEDAGFDKNVVSIYYAAHFHFLRNSNTKYFMPFPECISKISSVQNRGGQGRTSNQNKTANRNKETKGSVLFT
jgi:hypothetical protein